MKRLAIALFVALSAISAGAKNLPVEAQFRLAGKDAREFRGAPFWSWNDELDPGELRRQIRLMHASGMGGFFMHTRNGLLTPYFGQKYMECHAACVDEARKLGMSAWLYDEDRWPSGTAGGKVLAKGTNYQARPLGIREVKGGESESDASTLAVFKVRKENGKVVEAIQVPASELKKPGADMLLFGRQSRTYVDTLNQEAIAAFIDETHEVFKKLFKPDFGKTIPGIFTDEPNYCEPPWTDDFADEFRKRRGYDILTKLPALFYEVGDDWMRVRYDYWRTATELFVQSYTKQLGDWCGKEGFALTGHMLLEDTLDRQTRKIGAAMPHYEYMQVPGIDHLRRGLGLPMLVKQVSSVAEQLGKPRVISEMFGCSGWNMSFEDQKWIAEWQYALGVNLMCQHLALYSLKGCRKRDYPPSIFYQQPWWSDYRLVEDHLARLAAALTSGRAVADVLVIHPIESVWCLYNVREQDERVNRINDGLLHVSQYLQRMRADYHYGDESIMERHAKVEDGKLRVGEGAYSLVIIPPSLSLRTSTVTLLKKWIAGGGRVIVVGDMPKLVEGMPSEEPGIVLKDQPRVKDDFVEIRAQVLDAMKPRIQVLDADGSDAATICFRQRDLGNKQLFFLVNTDQSKSYSNAVVRIPGRGAVEEWDLDSGAIKPVTCRTDSGDTTFELRFEPTQSHLIAFDPRGTLAIGSVEKWVNVREQPLQGPWTIQWRDPNALTLDYCRYKVADGQWSEPTPTIWLEAKLSQIEQETPVTLRFTFTTAFAKQKPRGITLVMERPKEYEITVNGRVVKCKDAGWWTDISFKKIDIDSLVNDGENVIELKCRYMGEKGRRKLRDARSPFLSDAMSRMYTYPPSDVRNPIILPYSGELEEKFRVDNQLKYGLELESVYLIGDFGVYRDGGGFVLKDTPNKVETGDLVQQGAPFFRGRFVLKQTMRVERGEGERVMLALERPGAIVTKVRVNGSRAGTFIWRPMELDATRLLKHGENTFEFEMSTSCRNLLGPHHHKSGEMGSVGPGSFLARAGYAGIDDQRAGSAPADWTDEYSFVPTGLPVAPKLIFMKKG